MIYNPPKASNPASPSGSVQINSSGVFGALSGTGFLKLTGTTPSFDNTTYYPNSNPSSYIPLTALSAGTGISYNNTTGVITNSAPDQTVAIASGTGISATGTYPNFTVTNSLPMVYPGAGIAKSTGSAWGTSISGTSGQFVKGDGSLDSTSYGTFTLPALTSGSVLYSNGSTISQDNSNFFYDATNHRLALGTATSIATLTLNGNMTFPTGADRTIAVQNATAGAGNALTLLTGNAFNSAGTFTGGNFSLTTGTGNTQTAVGTAGNAGGITIRAANGGDAIIAGSGTNKSGLGGSVLFYAGNSGTFGGGTTNTAPTGAGNIGFTTGTGANTTADGATAGNAGQMTLTGGNGGSTDATALNSGKGGNGSNVTFNAGGGGASTGNVGTATANTGGAGGTWTLVGGNGGTAGRSAISNTAGAAGPVVITGGLGGGTYAYAAGTATLGGDVRITGGKGGSATPGVAGGSVFLAGGAGGTNAPANSFGNVYLNITNTGVVGGITGIGISPSGAQLHVYNTIASNVVQILKNNATPGDFLQLQNSGGAVLTKVNGAGVIFPVQAPTASAPTYVLGGMYFDTTLNKLRIGGATAWETVTSL